MQYLVTTEQMKTAERLCDERYISYSQLMENAGKSIAKYLIYHNNWCDTVILCGAGNNGGDGFVIAQELSEKLFSVSVILLCGKPKTDCAREYFEKLSPEMVYDYSENREQCIEMLEKAKIVVDCVFGTGFHGELPDNIREAFAVANKAPSRYSADVPSGVNSDDGSVAEGCFKPHTTFAIAALKKCITVPESRNIHGEVKLLDIGIPDDCYPEYIAELSDKSYAECLPYRFPTSHKGTFGRLLNIAGSLCYNGAAVMSTKAALRSGVGLCTLASPVSVVKAVCSAAAESTYLPLPETEDGFVMFNEKCEQFLAEMLPKMTAVSVGCGLGNSENTRRLVEFILRNAECTVILDADGINSLSDNINILKERTGNTIITPHPMEFSRISGLSVAEIQADRLGTAKRFAAEYGVTVVLKGSDTITTDGSAVILNTSGNAALAKGGSGDVLCGIIAALAAQGLSPIMAASRGVYVHGLAADNASRDFEQASVIASDVIGRLPMVLKQCRCD